jgi:hypothetical protein
VSAIEIFRQLTQSSEDSRDCLVLRAQPELLITAVSSALALGFLVPKSMSKRIVRWVVRIAAWASALFFAPLLWGGWTDSVISYVPVALLFVRAP